MATLTIHNDHATYSAQMPQAGTHTKEIMSMIMERPMGKVPENIDCTGWERAALNVCGYIAYRIILSMQPAEKRTTFKAKITMAIH